MIRDKAKAGGVTGLRLFKAIQKFRVYPWDTTAIERSSSHSHFLTWLCFQKCVLEILVLSDTSLEKFLRAK